MDSKILSKINVLATRAPFAELTDELMRFGEALSQLTWEESYRINPISFSQRFSLPLPFSIEAFIHGTDLGLFEIAWNQICPGCGGVEYSVPRIEDLHPGVNHCTICNLDVQSNLDEQIEVSFRLMNSTKRTSVDPNKDPETFRRLYFSPNYERSAELNQYSKERLVKLIILSPKESTTLEFTTTPGASLYRALSVKNHSQALLKVVPSTKNNNVHLNLKKQGFSNAQCEISPGPVTLRITNSTHDKFPLTLIRTDFDILHTILKNHPNKKNPFLSGCDLINCQTFREIFEFPNLPKDFFLPVKNITILFTDIKSSTELYEKMGDVGAYKCVRDHFDVLISSVRKNSGAVVKTIGDSIMASFSSPENAVRAAMDMMEETRKRTTGNKNLFGIKIGIHEGPALVVNSESKLDFFGQTINLCSRIVNAIQPFEIGFTQTILKAPKVDQILSTQRLSPNLKTETFKGFENPTEINVLHFNINQKLKAA